MTKQPISSLPPFTNMRYVESTGYMTNDGRSYNDNLWQTLNTIVQYFINGVVMPTYTSTEIDAFRTNDLYPIGSIWFNSDTNKLNVKVSSSAVEAITSTAYLP